MCCGRGVEEKKEKSAPMTRDRASPRSPKREQKMPAKMSSRKSVTFDDWLRTDDGKYAVLQEALVADDDECEF